MKAKWRARTLLLLTVAADCTMFFFLLRETKSGMPIAVVTGLIEETLTQSGVDVNRRTVDDIIIRPPFFLRLRYFTSLRKEKVHVYASPGRWTLFREEFLNSDDLPMPFISVQVCKGVAYAVVVYPSEAPSLVGYAHVRRILADTGIPVIESYSL